MQNTFSNHMNLNGVNITLSMHDIETNDEMEDRILLERAANMLNSSAVYFRFRKDIWTMENDDDEIYLVYIKFPEEPQISTKRLKRGTKECHEQCRISLCDKSCNSSNTS
uniref:Uncharacterized protein n=1 Tax=Wuchereria bancrofti TaxID=6293 RepID=A0AAF5PTE3_WUCBA